MPKQALVRLSAKRKAKALVIRQRKRHPNRALTEAQIRNLLSAIENIRDVALIRLGLSVGLRVSEVVSIRTSEIDFDRGLIKRGREITKIAISKEFHRPSRARTIGKQGERAYGKTQGSSYPFLATHQPNSWN